MIFNEIISEMTNFFKNSTQRMKMINNNLKKKTI